MGDYIGILAYSYHITGTGYYYGVGGSTSSSGQVWSRELRVDNGWRRIAREISFHGDCVGCSPEFRVPQAEHGYVSHHPKLYVSYYQD